MVEFTLVLPVLLVLMEGEARVRGANGKRTVPARELFAGHLETTLEPGEWIEEVRLPVQNGRGGAFEEFARRHGDYALCGVAALTTDDGVALSFVGMGPVPLRLEGDVSTAVGRLEPEDDIHASARYRLHLAQRLGERVARRAREGV